MPPPTDPSDRRYTATHEWVRLSGSRATIGITNHAQQELTDVVYVELPVPGQTVKAGERLAALESVKTVADVYAPLSGRVVRVNEALKQHPEQINKDPYGEGWIAEIEVEGPVPELWDAETYARSLSPGPSKPSG
jgi:glycine cleavage system H protein